MPQGNEVLGVERQRRPERGLGVVESADLEQRLRVHDVPAHMAGLLREVGLADKQRLIEIAYFAILICKRRKIPARILVEFLFQLVDSGRTGHLAPSIADTRQRAEAQDRTNADNTQPRRDESIRSHILT